MRLTRICSTISIENLAKNLILIKSSQTKHYLVCSKTYFLKIIDKIDSDISEEKFWNDFNKLYNEIKVKEIKKR